MEQRFYKVRLTSGRVLGPLDLGRLKLFIANGTVTGLETARHYPTGDWRDINHFPEVAELLIQKLEGKLVVDSQAVLSDLDALESEPEKIDLSIASSEGEKAANDQVEAPQLVKKPEKTVSKKAVQLEESTKVSPVSHEDATVLVNADSEHTVLIGQSPKNADANQIILPSESGLKPVELPNDPGEIVAANLAVASEKTVVIERPKDEVERPHQPAAKRKVFLGAVAAVVLAVLFLLPDEKATKVEPPFRVEMPVTAAKQDPQAAEKLYVTGLKIYAQDTIEGYKEAAKVFLKAVSLDSNNVRAICMLASSYLNLIDVVKRDENYFTVVTRLIELERARNMDFAETVIADVELYQVLGNPDAAINRIVEYSKTHPFGVEMYYYLANSFYMKGQLSDALKYLNNIDSKNYFSPKINYLYGLIYRKNLQRDEAIRSFLETTSRSPKHVKAHIALSALYFRKDNLPESSKHADYVIQNPSLASDWELSRAYFYRAKMHLVAGRENEALKDLEEASRINPESHEILLDLYTLKSRLGEKVKDANSKAKMFFFLAQGEKAMKEDKLHEALTNFISARDVQSDDATPLMKIADVLKRKGDFQAAKQSYEKAVKIAPKKTEIYPKYVRTLVDAYEFEEAVRALNVYKGLNPSVASVDFLQGEIYFKQDKFQEAHTYFKRALSGANVDPSIYVSYASLMARVQNHKDAAFYFGLALRFDPFNIESVIGIGKALAELESLDRGVQYLQEALQGSPNRPALLNAVAEIYLAKSSYEQATKFVNNLINEDKTYARAYKTKGDIFVAQEKYKEALDAYQTYTNLAPLDPAGYVERYKVFMKKMDLKAAKETIEKVIDNYPKYPGVYYMLGELYRVGQNYESALKAAQEEMKNNPTYVPAYVLAGTALNQMKDYNSAIQALNKAIKMNPNYVPALIQAGIANHLSKTYAAAQSMLERALSLDSGNPEIHKRLGILFHDLGNKDRERQHFRAYLDLYPNAPDRAEVEQVLSR